MLCKGYRTAGDSKQHHTLPTIRHHGPFEGVYPTVWKWPLRAKLPHIHRWVMVKVPKGRPVVGRSALGCAQGPTARTNPGTQCLAPGNGTWPTPGKKWGSLQGHCSQEEMQSWSHLQIQRGILLEHISSASTKHRPAAIIRPNLPASGLWEPFHVRLHQPASCRPCNYGLLLLHDY